jgi:hypothetical protein
MEFFWIDLDDPALTLSSGHGELLPRLRQLVGAVA